MSSDPYIDPEIFLDFSAFDMHAEEIGSVGRVWTADDEVTPQFFGINIGSLRHELRAVPAEIAEIELELRAMRIPYRKEQVNDSPRVDDNSELDGDAAGAVRDYYARLVPGGTSPERDLGEALS